MIDPLLLAVTRVTTLKDQQHFTSASGFFYCCGKQFFVLPAATCFGTTRVHTIPTGY